MTTALTALSQAIAISASRLPTSVSDVLTFFDETDIDDDF
jgi:hypothetical protein